MRVSITVALLVILTLTFANIYANRYDLAPMTSITLNDYYGSEDDYYEDFFSKSVWSGHLLWRGFGEFLGVIPGMVQTGQSVINAVIDVGNTIGGWLADVWDFLRGLVDVGKGGLVYENYL